MFRIGFCFYSYLNFTLQILRIKCKKKSTSSEGLQFYEAFHLIFYYIQQPKIQMHKHKYYKPPKPSTLVQKPINVEVRPQFTTDFTDPDKYKLSELQMVQKKAALQSKNREAARLDLEERRKKLQMGIIDEETRKIYQTALISKKIDLNPSTRRNLSQMIQYQRQKSRNKFDRRRENTLNQKAQENFGQSNQEEKKYQKEIKNAQNLIKKLERAKKQQNISKAIGILFMDDKKSEYFGPLKSEKKIQKYEESDNYLEKSIIQEETLSNIEETIKFMEQKLFKSNNAKKIPASPSINKNIEINSIEKNQRKELEKQQISYQSFQNDLINNYRLSSRVPKVSNMQKGGMQNSLGNQDSEEQFNMQQKLSELKLNFNQNVKLFNKKSAVGMNQKNMENQFESFQEDDQQTIRKMKQMMEINSCLFDNSDCFKSKENQNKNKINQKGTQNYQEINPNLNIYLSKSKSPACKIDGDMQIDFSLTLNQDEIQLKSNRKITENTRPLNNKLISSNNYLEMKKSLFEEIQKLQVQGRCQKEIGKQLHIKNQFKRGPLSQIQPQDGDEYEQKEIEQQIPVKYQYRNCIENNYKKTEEKVSEVSTKQTRQIDNIKTLIEKSKNNISNSNSQVQNIIDHSYSQKSTKISQNEGKKIMGFDYRGSINIKKHINSGHVNFKIN